MAHPYALVAIFGTWAIAAVVLAVVVVRRTPAVSLALFGGVLGGTGAFLFANAHGSVGVPVTTAVGASLGLVACA